MEVSLSQSASGSSNNEVLTEIDLNPNRNEFQNSETIIVNLTPRLQSNDNLPPLSELPSYTEALKNKNSEANANELPPGYFTNTNSGSNETRFPVVDNFDVSFTKKTNRENFKNQNQLRAFAETEINNYDQDIGSECMFLSAFMIAFFFNWVGFFASICLIPNAAGKYGALSGFGLSMAKWVTIIRVIK